MEPSTLLIAFAILVFTLLFTFSNAESRRVRSLMSKLPGPLCLPLFGVTLPLMFRSRIGRSKYIEGIIVRNSPLFGWWLGPFPVVDVSKPEYLKAVLKNTDLNEKSFVYDFAKPWLGTGLLTSSGEKWYKHRKIITPTFHFSILDGFVDIFAEKCDVLINQLQDYVGKDFEIYRCISLCSMNIINETAMGISLEQSDGSSEYINAIYKMTETLVNRALYPFLYPTFLFNLSRTGKEQKRSLETVNAFVNKVIEKRKEQRLKTTKIQDFDEDLAIGRKKRVAFLDMLLDASEAGENLTDDEIREEVHTFMFEGHDTVSVALNWALFELGHHPHIQDKILEEQNEIFQRSDRAPTMKDLNNMNYLERVIKESLRLHPSVPIIGRNVRKDFELGGYTIPKGTQLDFPIFVLHRNPKVFPNPLEFNPDHFLPEKVANRHPFAYIPFSAGSRNCIGQRFAILEEKMVLSRILKHFEVRSVDSREDVQYALDIINRPSKPIIVSLTPRKPNTAV